MKKPIYKKWWFWAIIIVLAIGIIGSFDEEDTNQEEQTDNAHIEETEEENTEEEGVTVIEHEDEFTFGEYTVNNIRTTVDGDEIKIAFDWTNQSGSETPFTALGYLDVTQGNETLDETSGVYTPGGNSLLQRQTDNGVTVPGEATFKILNDEPIEVRFGATSEHDDNTYELVID